VLRLIVLRVLAVLIVRDLDERRAVVPAPTVGLTADDLLTGHVDRIVVRALTLRTFDGDRHSKELLRLCTRLSCTD
jgi:hypothetical protein